VSTTALRDAANEQNSTFHQFTKYLDDNLGEIRTEVKAIKENPDLPGETKQTIEKMQEALREQKEHIDGLLTKLNQPKVSDQEQDISQKRKDAFNKALRLGSPARLNEEERKYVKWDGEMGISSGGLEQKTLYAADGTTGGFLTVPEYVDSLIKAIVLISNLQQYCDVRETTAPYIMIPKRTQTASAYRISEQATRTEGQNPKFGLVQVFPYEAAALALISRTDLDDASLDLGQFIMDEFAEQFAKLQGAEYINGLGNPAGQALGFLNDSAVTNASATGSGLVQITTTAASLLLDYASLVKLIRTMKPGYLPGSIFVMANETLGAVQQLTDSQGRPLWVPFGTALPSDMIFGYPIAIAPDMPQIAANAFAIAFGNFKRGYQIVIRKQISIQVLQERYADQNAVGYIGYYRFGGTVKLAECIKLLKVHA
jgi:HK97 family phage major capsid protein